MSNNSIEGSDELEANAFVKEALRKHVLPLPDPLHLVRFRKDVGRFKKNEMYFIPRSSWAREESLFDDDYKAYFYTFDVPDRYQNLDVITYVDIVEERNPKIKKAHRNWMGRLKKNLEFSKDAKFEQEHPRANDGKFGDKDSQKTKPPKGKREVKFGGRFRTHIDETPSESISLTEEFKDAADEPIGRCFEHAFQYLFRTKDAADMILVHGFVNGQGRQGGKRFEHAWIEDGDRVIDPSLDPKKPLIMPKAEYYALGGIKNPHRYTRTDAMVQAVKTEHYGNWEDLEKILRKFVATNAADPEFEQKHPRSTDGKFGNKNIPKETPEEKASPEEEKKKSDSPLVHPDYHKAINNPRFHAWFKNSKVVDDNGKPQDTVGVTIREMDYDTGETDTSHVKTTSPKVLYHGSPEMFKRFNMDLQSEWNDLGRSIYFSDNQEYVAKYADKSQVSDSKKRNLVEEMYETVSDFGLGWDDAKKLVEEDLNNQEDKGHVFSCFLRLEKPVVLKKSGGTQFEKKSFFRAWNKTLMKNNHGGILKFDEMVESRFGLDIPDVLHVDAFKFYEFARTTGQDMTGAPMGELVRQTFEIMGHDGVIHHELENLGVNAPEGTKHYAVFEPHNVKAVASENFDESDDIFKSSKR